nr:MAG TPA: hypothetical protein [Bacteriophage sp.]
MNISDPFYNWFSVVILLFYLSQLISLEEYSLAFSLAKNKERYLHINPVLCKHQTNGRLD